MIRRYQTRIGENGNCFATALANILETPVPEFGIDENYWVRVDTWLAARGLRYDRIPLTTKPIGWHTVEGISPRGGLHSVVGYAGDEVFDPHPPSDDPRRGLVKPQYYGVLTPLEDGVATDAFIDPSDGSVHPDPKPARQFKAWAEKRQGKDAVRPYKAGDKIILPNGKLATVTKCMPAENLLGEKEWHVSTKTGEVLPIPVRKARAKDADEPRCAVCGSNVEEAQGYTRKAWCSECGKVQPMRESRNTWGPTKAQDRSRYHAALDRALDAALFQEPYKGFDLQLELLASLNGKAVWTARLNGKLRGWRERLPELKTAIAAGDIGA